MQTQRTMTAKHAQRHAIRSVPEAEQLIATLDELMVSLLGLVQEETTLVRAGRLNEAAGLEAKKSELAGQYFTAIERLKTNTQFLSTQMSDGFEALRRRHDSFRAVLQMNLTVLATAHAVSEGIIRGVADEVTRKAAPQSYGASGRPATPTRQAMQPVAISRTL